MKFKPFPTTIKEDKIKMGYEFKKANAPNISCEQQMFIIKAM